MLLLQVVLILSGNLSFLNWLTILPAIFCFDDLSLKWLFSSQTQKRVMQLQQQDKRGVVRPLGEQQSGTLFLRLQITFQWPPQMIRHHSMCLCTLQILLGCGEAILYSSVSVGYYIRQASNVAVALLLAYLSIPVVQNLLSPRQLMNSSFDPLKIVNTYGAFGRYCVCMLNVCLYQTRSVTTLAQKFRFKF